MFRQATNSKVYAQQKQQQEASKQKMHCRVPKQEQCVYDHENKEMNYLFVTYLPLGAKHLIDYTKYVTTEPKDTEKHVVRKIRQPSTQRTPYRAKNNVRFVCFVCASFFYIFYTHHPFHAVVEGLILLPSLLDGFLWSLIFFLH